MPEQIIDGTGSGNYLAGVTSENRLMVDLSGTSLFIGSVTANVDSIYIQSGNNITGSFYRIPVTPTLVSSNPAGSLTYVGNLVGSITVVIGASSYVKRLTYSGTDNVLVNIGSWS